MEKKLNNEMPWRYKTWPYRYKKWIS